MALAMWPPCDDGRILSMCRACGTLPHSKAKNHPEERADAVAGATVRTPVEGAEGWDGVVRRALRGSGDRAAADGAPCEEQRCCYPCFRVPPASMGRQLTTLGVPAASGPA